MRRLVRSRKLKMKGQTWGGRKIEGCFKVLEIQPSIYGPRQLGDSTMGKREELALGQPIRPSQVEGLGLATRHIY